MDTHLHLAAFTQSYLHEMLPYSCIKGYLFYSHFCVADNLFMCFLTGGHLGLLPFGNSE